MTWIESRHAQIWPFLFCSWYLSLSLDDCPSLGQPGLPASPLSTGPGQAWPPNPHLYVQGLDQPGPPTPHLYRQSLGQSGPQTIPKPLTLSTGPRPARPSSPHFYWPDPSLLLLRPLTSIGHDLMASSWPSWAVPANRSVVYS